MPRPKRLKGLTPGHCNTQLPPRHSTTNPAKQQYLLPHLQDLCRALRTGLTNSPHREPLWKGTWTSPLISTLADTARANTRQNLWRSSAAISLLTKTLQGFGAITTTYVLNAWKLRRRAAFQIHQQICAHTNPSHFDHVPRLPHIESIKFMEPILTADQLPFILQRLLRLNPARPDPTLRTFGRRRRHFQLMQQPPTPDIPATVTLPNSENNFTIGTNNRPQLRPSLSLIASLSYCVCCLCGQDHSIPDCTTIIYGAFIPPMMMTQLKTLSPTP